MYVRIAKIACICKVRVVAVGLRKQRIVRCEFDFSGGR